MTTATRSPADWTSCRANIVPPPRRADLTAETLDQEVVLVDSRNGHIHRLNESALVVWRQCDGRQTTRDIAAGLTEHYDLLFDDALDHVEQLVARLLSLDLLAGDER